MNKRNSVFIKTSIDAIKKDQDRTLRISLQCLNDIAHEYLEQSKEIRTTQDNFLDNLNDQFNFMIVAGLESNNQKVLEDIAKTIGDIAKGIIENRIGIGDTNNLALNWVGTLKDLFIKSYPKDRTVVCQICLEKINDVVILALEKGYYRSYDVYRMSLDDLAGALAKIDQLWAAILLQRALLMYQNQFLKFLELSKTGKVRFNEDFIERYFEKFSQIINVAKINHKSHSNNTIIFASPYGLDSFAQKIAKMRLDEITDEGTKRRMAICLRQFMGFNKKILRTNPEKNDYRVMEYFNETLFLLSKRVNLTDEGRRTLIETLTDDLLHYAKLEFATALDEDSFRLHEFEEVLVDYFAMLIYLHYDKPELIQKSVKKLAQLYSSIKAMESKNKVRLTRHLYRHLKLYACWCDIFDSLKEINAETIKILKDDFFEQSFPGRFSVPPLFEQYDYPETGLSMMSGMWFLHPSHMWGNRFQDEIVRKLNGENGQHYIAFHELLKKNG